MGASGSGGSGLSAPIKRRSELDTGPCGCCADLQETGFVPGSVFPAADHTPNGDDQSCGNRKQQGPDERVGYDLNDEDRGGLDHPGSVHTRAEHRFREEHGKGRTRIPAQQAAELYDQGISKADKGPQKSGKTYRVGPPHWHIDSL